MDTEVNTTATSANEMTPKDTPTKVNNTAKIRKAKKASKLDKKNFYGKGRGKISKKGLKKLMNAKALKKGWNKQHWMSQVNLNKHDLIKLSNMLKA